MMETREKLTTKDALILARDGSLKKWDVEFVMGAEIFYNIMDFMTELNTDVPMTFYPDKIVINVISYDTIQYGEIIIPKEDLVRYSSGLDNNENGSSNNPKKVDPKFVLVDMNDIIDEMGSNIDTGKPVKVRIDTKYMRRIEFYFGTGEGDTTFESEGNTIIWGRLIDPSQVKAKLLGITGKIKSARENSNITRGVMALEPLTFAKIMSIGGKGGKTGSTIFLMQVDRNGIIISSGNKMTGRTFRITDVLKDSGDYSSSDGGSDDEWDAVTENSELKQEKEQDIDKKEKDKGNKYIKKGADKHFLLSLDVDKLHYVRFDRDYMKCFLKLKGLSHITIEVRTDKPVVIEQKINSTMCLLTVAPRIDDEDDN
jgi:hypothetical protein